MNCNECAARERKTICEACRKMQQESTWKWEIDTGNRLIRCPDCGKALSFPFFGYSNPYNFCPYCGKRRITHEQISLLKDMGAVRCGEK